MRPQDEGKTTGTNDGMRRDPEEMEYDQGGRSYTLEVWNGCPELSSSPCCPTAQQL